ncbi:hypothetical protein Patl1_25177 [Pistacia atlantica]|uniref:Uncharacterized protein n=1 Tax=Pistacia atlantica TaxID=434234 RepID=A0ACC1B526_9ROSI|nr:hypothetical protein Patl1_25177 [Pistacia atlantica]
MPKNLGLPLSMQHQILFFGVFSSQGPKIFIFFSFSRDCYADSPCSQGILSFWKVNG